jgi:DNA primase
MEQSEKEAIRERTDIVDLISAYTPLKRAGSKYKGLCPFHTEKTPSFNVDPELRRWHCFGACSMGGDVFTFLEKAENLTFIEAAQRLAEKAGITLTTRGGDREAAQRQQSEKETMFAVNAAALQFYRDCFRRDDAAREYALGRGLVHETLEAFQIGYAPDDWSQLSDFLRKQKIHPDDAEKAGLIFPSRFNDGTYTDRFRGRLLFPIVDVQERVVAFGGRLIGDVPNAPKYLNSPETPVFSKSKVLYGLNRARKAIQERDLVLVVEGYMDVVAAHQAGLAFVVATLGTSLTEEHVRLIRRYTKNVVLSFDADNAGVKAALRAGELFQASGEDITLRVLTLPEGEDPDSLLKRGDVPAFHRAIETAVSVPEFRVKSLEKQYDISTETGKLALLREAVGIIAAVPSILQQDMLIRRVAAYHPAYGTNGMRAEESIRAEIRRAAGPTAPVDENGGPQQSGYPFRRGGGPTGFRRDGAGQFGGGFRSEGGYNRGKQFGRSDRAFVQPDSEPTPQLPPAALIAERTILKALLSDAWCASLLRRIPGDMGPALTGETANLLVEAIWPLIRGKLAPTEAIAELSDPELADLADVIRMADEDVDLSEETIDDALRLNATFHQQREIEQIRVQLGERGEGNGTDNDELLRQWSEKARTLKGPGKSSDEE